MDNGGMPEDWRPSPPPEVGSWAWKNDIAFGWCQDNGKFDFGNGFIPVSDRNRIVKVPTYEGHRIGYLVISKKTDGTDYFRVEEIA